MKSTADGTRFWQKINSGKSDLPDLLPLVLIGFLIGACAGAVVSFFRFTAEAAFKFALGWTFAHRHSLLAFLIFFAVAFVAALITGRLIRDPAIRSGGVKWIKDAILSGQPRVWRVILAPKFLGSWLVKACGISVGMEGPSIQMGCATALGLENLNKKKIERRYFVLGGAAAGLSTAFSSPFAGICYVYEVMHEQMSRNLFLFLLSGSLGVYVSCIAIFDLGQLLPFTNARIPGLGQCWLLPILACLAAVTGIIYNYLLEFSTFIFNEQKLVPERFRPLFAYLAAAILIFIFPAVTGEGMDVFPAMDAERASLAFLCILLLFKLLFTAYCFGTGIPAGRLVPVLCVGGITGAIFSICCQQFGLVSGEYHIGFIAMGMAGSFAASERAPVTALVLVAQMTGAWSLSAGILLVAAIATFLGRLAGIR